MVSVSEYLKTHKPKAEENLRVDMSNTTSKAFIKIDKKKSKGISPIMGEEELKNHTGNKSRVKVFTPFDEKTHTYFHSMTIDNDIADFMGTAELRCPYDRDLMSYWEPARAYCVIYGSNHGDYKVLFIGRVREVNQQGYEIAISLQNYGWKFKQIMTQGYANDNVLNKDGYTIMKLIFEALRIDSWVISPTAKYRLQQVGVDEDGNVTLNKQKVEEMPDLLKRLKSTDPNHGINQYTVYNKIKESELHNIKNINYTLYYKGQTKKMQKIARQNNYQKGKDIYGTNYGSNQGDGTGVDGAGGGGAGTEGATTGCTAPSQVCSGVQSSSINEAMQEIWLFNRGCTNSYSSAYSSITDYARQYPAAYRSQASPCLDTLSKYCIRKDGTNAANIIKWQANTIAAGTTSKTSGKTGASVSVSRRQSSTSSGGGGGGAQQKKGLLGLNNFLGFL